MTSVSILTSENNSKAALTQFLIEMEPALSYLIIIVGAVPDLWLVELIYFVFFGVVF